MMYDTAMAVRTRFLEHKHRETFAAPKIDATNFSYIGNIAYKELHLGLGINLKSLQWIAVQCISQLRIQIIWINNSQGL